MKILITGANGFVGSHLCERLLKEGHDVFALVRNKKKFTDIKHERLMVIQGDLDHANLLWIDSLPLDLDTCVHTAGIVHAYNTHEFFRVNTEGSLHLVNALKKKFTQLHFILISSLAAAGPSLGSDKRNENDLSFPVSLYGKSKGDAEEVVRKNAPESWSLTVVRPPMVIGPRDAAVLDIFKMVKSGLILLPGYGSKEKLYSFVCVFDLVETIYQTMIKRKTGLFYSSHPQTVTFNELILEIKRQLKKNWLIYIPLPLILVRLLTIILDLFYKLRPHPLRLTPDKYYELAATNWTCDGRKSEVELGQVYNYDMQRTVTVTLIDYKSRHWI